MSDVLLEERPADGVALLRLNRPAVLNALNLELRHALANASNGTMPTRTCAPSCWPAASARSAPAPT
jgi:hypothetical protein